MTHFYYKEFWSLWSQLKEERLFGLLIMEQKGLLLSALSVGVGVGVGLGLATGQSVVTKWSASNSSSNLITADKLEQEMLKQIVDGRQSKVTFEDFPYYLRYLSPLSLIAIDTVLTEAETRLIALTHPHR